jgi:hypothetical protein
MSLTTTDSIQLQMQNLVPAHEYKVEFKINNPSNNSLVAYLDKYLVTFSAASTKQNIFVLLTKDADLPIVTLEVTTTNLTDNKIGSSSMIIQCPDFTGCDASYLPLSINS